ncbi:AraC family transcriptional regulator [Noviherbaspirillum malthae]|uniref:AraC family transcriptional regulator n=1 Tax=Noviherbaspirillum malthae TaxID=1260987 RepID=UPI00188E7AAE|nr:helix-turn-helix transcriptional regulator [Noviherbaspirillum malthae]
MALQPITHTRVNLPGRAPSPERPVRMMARDLDVAEVLAGHHHVWGQVTYAIEGVLRVTAENSTWIVPPHRAIWIPPLLNHEVTTLEKTRLRALYVHADSAPFHGTQCEVLEVSPLLRELVVALGHADEGSVRETLLSALLLNELAGLATLPIRVALPSDKRLKALCESVIADPASPLTLEEWAEQVGASARTLARLFERELGTSFREWRQQVRLAHAAPLIARGMPLSQVAAELGYASQSAFSAMFRKTFGQPPSVFFARQGG